MRALRPFLIGLIILPMLLFSSSSFADEPGEIRLHVKTSETLSLLYFARAALGQRHVSPRLGEIWAEHHEAEHEAALAKIQSALSAAPSGIEYYANARERPSGRHNGVSLIGLLEIRAGAASDLDDFSARITGLLSPSAHASLIEGLGGIAALHDAHVWKPSRGFLERSRRKLQQIGDRHDAAKRFGQVARFYGARWPADIPVTIYLVGVPGDEVKRTNGHSIGAVEVAEVVEGDNLESRFAVLFHEMCHSLYGAQPLGLQHELARWFDDHPLPIAAVAYAQLNEGLATALGNGWMEVAIRGDAAFEESWYADDVIDTFARSLYPLVTHYLEHGKRIDRAFVDRAVAHFAWKFPDVMEDPRLMFRKSLILLSGGFDARQLMGDFQREFDANAYGAQPISHDRTFSRYDQMTAPTVFVLQRDRLHELDRYAFGSEAMDRLSELFGQHDAFVWVSRLGDGRLKVFVGASDRDAVHEAFDAMKGAERLTEGTVLTW